jgi:hypothetical protein
MGERIRPDLGLQLCMTVALLLGAAVTVALAVGLVWLTLFSHGGYGVTAMLALCALDRMEAWVQSPTARTSVR